MSRSVFNLKIYQITSWVTSKIIYKLNMSLAYLLSLLINAIRMFYTLIFLCLLIFLIVVLPRSGINMEGYCHGQSSDRLSHKCFCKQFFSKTIYLLQRFFCCEIWSSDATIQEPADATTQQPADATIQQPADAHLQGPTDTTTDVTVLS